MLLVTKASVTMPCETHVLVKIKNSRGRCCIRPNSLILDKLEDYMITFLEKEFRYFRRTR